VFGWVLQELSHKSPVLSWYIGIELSSIKKWSNLKFKCLSYSKIYLARFIRILDSNFRISERIEEKSEII
jgi:hypothetical protein